ncbi:hypothetical protein [Rhodopirellula bahusiensis]|uniref:Uncharacterized protein n=1 Tax=Rhodopirellula bahusiensis TaxID=2014065 RepID=A0A2G1W6V5_9BACT|nr:hypothetical protein [Rhodopirellula bahusiensis]PHQ34570.1 hypothetical protein CEE69_14220 [Rhodopirellula bahusiensis]
MSSSQPNPAKTAQNATSPIANSHMSDAGQSPVNEYRELRAPTKTLGTLIEPSLCDAELLLKNNLATAQAEMLAGSFWANLRNVARQQLVSDARRYTSSYRDVASFCADQTTETGENNSRPIVMAGHQPTLFHPGVWFKNHTLQKVAGDCCALPINLVIDNDVASARSIRVPQLKPPANLAGDDSDAPLRGSWQSVPYDQGGETLPFEQAQIRDTDLFNHFDSGVRRLIAPLVDDPCVTALWKHAREAIARCGIAGCALAQARHALEADMNWQTLEIPLGVAVRGLPFATFVMEIIDEIERFQTVYNDSADHYRAWHGIRSSAHPVPNLGVQDGWYEVPLWVYGNSQPQRRGVWVRREGDQWHISDAPSTQLNPSSAKNRSAANGSVSLTVSATNRELAATQLAEAASPEFKLRPRALMTTMFARLVLSDLFLHGIGGGKYDQLADRIIAQFFGITPPSLQVVSGTIRLPGQEPDANRDELRRELLRKERELQFQGEKWLDAGNAEQKALRDQKLELLDQMPTSGSRRTWHHSVSRLNSQITLQLSEQRRETRGQLARLDHEAATERILCSRELSFCLFPLDFLQESFAKMA